MSRSGASIRDDTSKNPNALHDFHKARRGPKNVPHMVVMSKCDQNGLPKDPGHPYSKTTNIRFDFHDQRTSNAPFGYEHFISLPPGYEQDKGKRWPLILFLHGAGSLSKGRMSHLHSSDMEYPKSFFAMIKSGQIPQKNRPEYLSPWLRDWDRIGRSNKGINPWILSPRRLLIGG